MVLRALYGFWKGGQPGFQRDSTSALEGFRRLLYRGSIRVKGLSGFRYEGQDLQSLVIITCLVVLR